MFSYNLQPKRLQLLKLSINNYLYEIHTPSVTIYLNIFCVVSKYSTMSIPTP